MAIDGAAVFSAVAEAIEAARVEVLIAGWWVHPDVLLRRPDAAPTRPDLTNPRPDLGDAEELVAEAVARGVRAHPHVQGAGGGARQRLPVRKGPFRRASSRASGGPRSGNGLEGWVGRRRPAGRRPRAPPTTPPGQRPPTKGASAPGPST